MNNKSAPTTEQKNSHERMWQLEALRGFAALYVLAHHISSSYLKLKHTIWGLPFRFGQEAVLIFFLLSGFVICYSHRLAGPGRDNFKTYLIKRGRRIYPIFLLSLLLAYIIACIGAHALAPVDWRTLAGNLFMLQDHPERPGYLFLPFDDNMPLWSLSFEWWFYMMFFPIYHWVPAQRQKFIVLGLCLTGVLVNFFLPNGICWFLVFFLIWWAGVELAREFSATGNVTISGQKTMLAFLGIPMLWYGLTTWSWRLHGQPLTFITFPFVEFRYFLMAPFFIMLMFAWKRTGFAGLNCTLGWFRKVGLISYALYLFHYPIICDLRLLATDKLFYLDLILRVLLAFLLAWLAEGLLQPWIKRATNPWLKHWSSR